MITSNRDAAVVIGASNVSRGLSQLVAVLSNRHQRSLDLFVTAGHGRSYGVSSAVGFRRLPSILSSGLWRDLDFHLKKSPEQRLSGLITDVGNDLIYGFPPETVAAWVEDVALRLQARQARLAIVRLPLESVSRASELRYLAIRAAFSPWLKLNFSEMKDAARTLDRRLQDIAKAVGAQIIDQPGDWYGMDVIHIRLRQIHELWNSACDAWGLPSNNANDAMRLSLASRLSLHLKPAEKRTLFGIHLEKPQPCYEQLWDANKNTRVWLH